MLKVFGNCLRVNFIFGTVLNLLWQNVKSIWQLFKDFFYICHSFEPTWAKYLGQISL